MLVVDILAIAVVIKSDPVRLHVVSVEVNSSDIFCVFGELWWLYNDHNHPQCFTVH